MTDAILAQMEEPARVRTENMTHVENIPYELAYPDEEPIPHGTDIEFMTVDFGPPPEQPDEPDPDVPGSPDVPDAPQPTDPPTEPPAGQSDVQRVAGDSRVATAAAVSSAAFASADTVVIATAEDYADALTGSSLAANLSAPLLLTPRDALADDVAAEIDRLGASRAILLGQTNALTPQVEEDLRGIGLETERIGGANRFATAALIMGELPPADEVLVVEGEHADPSRGWPDALSASTIAAFESRPVLLVNAERLPQETAGQLSADLDVTIVGGDAAVSPAVEQQIDDQAAQVARIAGADRYATSALAAAEAVTRGADPATTYVATGRNFADGLAAGAAAGADGGLLLLVDGVDLDASPETVDFIADNADAIDTLFVVGGTSVITTDAEQQLTELIENGDGDGSQNSADESSGDSGQASAQGASTKGSGAFAAPAGGVVTLAQATEDPTDEPSEEPTQPSDNNDPENADVPEGDAEQDSRRTGVREFAVAGSYNNGMQLIDITDPENPFIASVYDCGVRQGDVQIFERDGRTYATYTSEDSSSIIVESQCVQDAIARGQVEVSEDDKSQAYGTYVVDITDPYNPTSAGLIQVPEGSHNGTVHPSGDYFYNSDSRLFTPEEVTNGTIDPKIQVYDIRDFDNIERVFELDLPTSPGLGTSSHDITFNEVATDSHGVGDRGYSAALSQTVILDTSNPAEPVIIEEFEDEQIETEHQADPITLTTEDGEQREILVVEDELIGALPGNFCPGGGVHFYDITGDNELNPLANKIGSYFIPEVRVAGPNPLIGDQIEDEFGESGTCTAHVFRLYPDAPTPDGGKGMMTIAWYNAGVRVVDISGLADAPVIPGVGQPDPVASPVDEVGFFRFENSDTWSFKTNKFEEDGSFYGFGNDIIRGFDVYRFDAGGSQEVVEEEGGAAGAGMNMALALGFGVLPIVALVGRRRLKR